MKKCLTLLLALCMFFLSAAAEPAHDYNDPSIITVGLYPFVNDYDLFCRLTQEMWQEENVRLEFIYWDGYSELPENIDVLMYDALHTTALAETGWLAPLDPAEVEHYDDIIPYAWQGAYHNGILYGIPGFLCAFFLMHDHDDEELAAADDLLDVYAVLSQRQTDEAKPLDDTDGLLTDFASYVVNLYLESWIDASGKTSGAQDHPPIDNNRAMETLHALIRMAGKQLACPSGEYVPLDTLVEWFDAGYGRAYFGFSEHMGWMPERAERLDVRLISFTPEENVPAFYTDVLSINARITNDQKVESCKKLINLIASEELMTRLLTGDGDEPTYLLPARISTWQALSQRYPLYERLYEFVSDEEACILRLGPDIWDWMSEAYHSLGSNLPLN